MKSEIKYELPMFSSNLENEPQIEFKNMNVKIMIKMMLYVKQELNLFP